ncbi:MAG: hypothetical protein RR232_02455 [Clostridia bacterium]
MQRIAPNPFMPRQNAQTQSNTAQNASNAMMLARRIRNEQGVERARQYLIAMEPFLAPAERYHIADQLGIQVPRPSDNYVPQSQNVASAMPTPVGSGTNSGMGNPMQLIQMLSSLTGKGASPLSALGGLGGASAQQGGGMDPMMMAQLLGGMLGKK